ncbi:hypothetical protein BRC93_11835 [Halobacteriales archaeon QS_5_70_15]|nr:MAG: hypothetical protein BRC93_11835 [Halobacteriales archaeon QS_5_70_15]
MATPPPGALYGVDRMKLDGGTLLLVAREATSFDVRTDQWSDGGNVATVDPERGEQTAVYGFEVPTSTDALGKDTLYAGGEDGTVRAVPLRGRSSDGPDRTTPETDGWTTEAGVAGGGAGIAALVPGGGGVDAVYAGGSGGVAALSSDGRVRWRHAPRGALASGVAAADDRAFVLVAGSARRAGAVRARVRTVRRRGDHRTGEHRRDQGVPAVAAPAVIAGSGGTRRRGSVTVQANGSSNPLRMK